MNRIDTTDVSAGLLADFAPIRPTAPLSSPSSRSSASCCGTILLGHSDGRAAFASAVCDARAFDSCEASGPSASLAFAPAGFDGCASFDADCSDVVVPVADGFCRRVEVGTHAYGLCEVLCQLLLPDEQCINYKRCQLTLKFYSSWWAPGLCFLEILT